MVSGVLMGNFSFTRNLAQLGLNYLVGMLYGIILLITSFPFVLHIGLAGVGANKELALYLIPKACTV